METAEDKRRSSRVERVAWRIWGYVRDNSRSLDSERHMAAIEAIINKEISACESKLADARAKVASAEATIEMLTREPPPMPKAGEWNKAKKMSGPRAVWVVEYAMGRGVPRPLIAKRIGVEPTTIAKICEGVLWAEETAKIRAKYAK